MTGPTIRDVCSNNPRTALACASSSCSTRLGRMLSDAGLKNAADMPITSASAASCHIVRVPVTAMNAIKASATARATWVTIITARGE
nr:hypothetical protein [Humibacillus sp. DSM 29435]